MTNFKEELRNIINSFDSCLYENGDGYDTCGISNYRYEELISAITELVKGIVSNLGDACKECDECRTEILKRLD
jgi:hypothetical protein